MEKENIVPDIIDQVPPEVVEIVYPSGLKAEVGNELTPTQVKDEPTLKWNADNSNLYTVLMTDPDVPSRQDHSFGDILHWLVANVAGNDVKNGDIIANYIGSGPPLGSGLHRYIFVIFKQNERIDLSDLKNSASSIDGRKNFSIREFAKKHNLGQPIAGNFYQAQYDDYVPILHSKFKK